MMDGGNRLYEDNVTLLQPMLAILHGNHDAQQYIGSVYVVMLDDGYLGPDWAVEIHVTVITTIMTYIYIYVLYMYCV